MQEQPHPLERIPFDMCFSATASFVSAALLGGIGTVSVIQNTSNRHRMLTTIPLLFAVQQASEGVVWVTIGRPEQTAVLSAAVHLFLGFALLLWPVWLPMSLLQMEPTEARRRQIRTVIGVGCFVSAGGAFMLWRWPPVAVLSQHSIRYEYPHLGHGAAQVGYFLLYLVPALVPTFLSTRTIGRWIGVVLIATLVAAIVLKLGALTSVWCFFATAVSCVIVWSTHHRQQRKPLGAAPA